MPSAETLLENFTPVIDSMVEQYGLVTAAVYGRIWRYSKMKKGCCTASLTKIGKDIGLDRKTVERHTKKLCKDGYLIDLTPGVKNKPHEYKATKKAGFKLTITAYDNGKTESPTPKTGKSESPTRSDLESHLGETLSPLKKEHEETREETTTCADAPEPELDPVPEKKPLTGQNAVKAQLEQFFSELTKMPAPPAGSQKERRAASVSWWQPLLEMAAACDNDAGRTQELITWALARLDRDGLTVHSPKSLVKTAVAEQARRKRASDNGQSNARSSSNPAPHRPGSAPSQPDGDALPAWLDDTAAAYEAARDP